MPGRLAKKESDLTYDQYYLYKFPVLSLLLQLENSVLFFGPLSTVNLYLGHCGCGRGIHVDTKNALLRQLPAPRCCCVGQEKEEETESRQRRRRDEKGPREITLRQSGIVEFRSLYFGANGGTITGLKVCCGETED